jgi:hypothetical protein
VISMADRCDLSWSCDLSIRHNYSIAESMSYDVCALVTYLLLICVRFTYYASTALRRGMCVRFSVEHSALCLCLKSQGTEVTRLQITRNWIAQAGDTISRNSKFAILHCNDRSGTIVRRFRRDGRVRPRAQNFSNPLLQRAISVARTRSSHRTVCYFHNALYAILCSIIPLSQSLRLSHQGRIMQCAISAYSPCALCIVSKP